jgi:hypothetical protein
LKIVQVAPPHLFCCGLRRFDRYKRYICYACIAMLTIFLRMQFSSKFPPVVGLRMAHVILGYIGRLWKPPPESRSTPTVSPQVLSTLLAWIIPAFHVLFCFICFFTLACPLSLVRILLEDYIAAIFHLYEFYLHSIRDLASRECLIKIIHASQQIVGLYHFLRDIPLVYIQSRLQCPRDAPLTVDTRHRCWTGAIPHKIRRISTRCW